MTIIDKRLTKHFRSGEFKCKCRQDRCDAPPMKAAFMEKLEALRVDWGIALVPTSGSRCEYWNRKVGGSPKSQHLDGNAVDFYFAHESDVVAFVELAEKHGFSGIGAGTHRVHLDDRKGYARWTYDD